MELVEVFCPLCSSMDSLAQSSHCNICQMYTGSLVLSDASELLASVRAALYARLQPGAVYLATASVLNISKAAFDLMLSNIPHDNSGKDKFESKKGRGGACAASPVLRPKCWWQC